MTLTVKTFYWTTSFKPVTGTHVHQEFSEQVRILLLVHVRDFKERCGSCRICGMNLNQAD
jgi:hypothetical protein